jgi:hypothetical protein
VSLLLVLRKNVLLRAGKGCRAHFQARQAAGFCIAVKLIPAVAISFAALLLPLGAVLVMSVAQFSVRNLVLLVGYAVLVVIPGFPLRKSLFCAHCRQAELGCPAFEGMRGSSRSKA